MILTTDNNKNNPSSSLMASLMPSTMDSPSSRNIRERKVIIGEKHTTSTTLLGRKSAPGTPTGLRYSVNDTVDSYDRDVPIRPRRLSSFGSDALASIRSISIDSDSCTGESSSNVECSISHNNSDCNSNNSNFPTRSVTLIDLIDESFVVNSGAFGFHKEDGTSGRGRRRHSLSTTIGSPKIGKHRRRKSILDMIDRIDSAMPSSSSSSSYDDDDNNNDNKNIDYHYDSSSHVMTTRSYPRGVYVVPSNGRETATGGSGNTTVAFVSAEAFKQW
jgi:hypothetical protein